MEGRLFELFEKFYTEFKDFRSDMMDFKSDMMDFKSEMMDFKSEMMDFKSEMMDFKSDTTRRLTKLEINVEDINDKLSEAFEAIEAHAQINAQQHKEIMNELRGELNIVQLAVKRAAK